MLLRYGVALVVLLVVGIALRAGLSADVSGDSPLRALIIPVATIFLNTFNSSSTAIVLSALMMLAGAGLLFYFWTYRLAPVRRNLQAVANQLRLIDERITPASLAQVDSLMARFDVVSGSWALYRATLSRRPDGQIVALAPPDRYFDMGALERAGLRLRMFLGLPNDFVGIGLVFTFMGLVAGLYFASRSMLSPDISVARDALVQLLHAATFKFLTSITGIGVSLVISWAQRMLLGDLEAELAELRYLLERRFPFVQHASEPSVGPIAVQPTLASVAR